MSSFEVIGLIASIIVLTSFIPKNNLKLTRIINSCGAALFVIYGILIGAWSVWILNACCLVLNVYYIIRDHFKYRRWRKW